MAIFNTAKAQSQFGRLGKINKRIDAGNTNPKLQARADRLTTRLQPRVDKRLASGKLNENQTARVNSRFPGAQGMTTGGGLETTMMGDGGGAPKPNLNGDQWGNYMKALFPQTGGIDQVVNVADIEANPYYQQKQAKGEDSITRYMASRGLTDSATERAKFGDMNAQLLGDEYQQQRNYKQQEADRAQGNAGRFFNLLDSNANRESTNSQNNFNNSLNLYKAMSANSPLEYGYGAANSLSSLDQGYYGDQASLAGQNYGRVSGAGYQAPFPGAPDFSGIDMMEAINNGQTSQNTGANWGDLAGGLFSGLSNYF